jgi:hypothetical protein
MPFALHQARARHLNGIFDAVTMRARVYLGINSV